MHFLSYVRPLVAIAATATALGATLLAVPGVNAQEPGAMCFVSHRDGNGAEVTIIGPSMSSSADCLRARDHLGFDQASFESAADVQARISQGGPGDVSAVVDCAYQAQDGTRYIVHGFVEWNADARAVCKSLAGDTTLTPIE
jgi:hypothetical protein